VCVLFKRIVFICICLYFRSKSSSFGVIETFQSRIAKHSSKSQEIMCFLSCTRIENKTIYENLPFKKKLVFSKLFYIHSRRSRSFWIYTSFNTFSCNKNIFMSNWIPSFCSSTHLQGKVNAADFWKGGKNGRLKQRRRIKSRQNDTRIWRH